MGLVWRLIPKADLSVVLDAPPEVLQARKLEVPLERRSGSVACTWHWRGVWQTVTSIKAASSPARPSPVCSPARRLRSAGMAKGAWRDNVFVERLWRSVNTHVYDSVSEARASIGRYFDFYSQRRPHASLDGATPDHAYFNLLRSAWQPNPGRCSLIDAENLFRQPGPPQRRMEKYLCMSDDSATS